MTIMSDNWIKKKALEEGMIEPFVDGQKKEGTISFVFHHMDTMQEFQKNLKFLPMQILLQSIQKNFDDKGFVDRPGKECIIPPNSFALARTVEYFRIPRDVLVVCLGKSTYARCGIIVNVTPLEPEWEGHVTLEFSNTTPLPAKIYANEGACQFLFYKGEAPPEVSYKDRKGKYMMQKGVTLPKL